MYKRQVVHNVELTPGKGGQIARAAGTSVQILGREGKYAILRLQSGEVRKVLQACRATVGQVGNEDYNLINWVHHRATDCWANAFPATLTSFS